MRNLFNGISSVLNELISALNNKADISDVPTTLSQLSDDSTHRVVTDTEKTTWNGKANTSDIPTTLSQLSDDSTHRVVTDTEKSTWNSKSNFSGSYNDLSNKPTIPSSLADLTTDNAKGAVRYGKTWGSTLGYSFDKDGLIIDQRQDESSGVQFNGDYVAFWAPADGYCMRFFDEDNSNEIWNIDANGKFSGTIDWANVNGSNQALKMKGWWASGSSNNADNLNNGSVFAYAASHNTPTTGPLFAFASEDGNKYVAQLQFQYNGDAVYHRVKNGDNNTWRAWQAFKSQADVNSAYSSGYQQRIETITLSDGQTGKVATNVGLPRSMKQYSYIFVYGRLYLGLSGYYGVMGGFDPNNLTKTSLSTSSSGTLTDCIAYLRLMGTDAYVRVVRYVSDTQIYISYAYDKTQNYKITTYSEQYLIPMTIVMVRK